MFIGSKDYFPSEVGLTRGYPGYVDNIARLDGWTQQWVKGKSDLESCASERSNCQQLEFKTDCGDSNAVAQGEVYKRQDGVPTSCHCKQLALGNAGAGVRSWRWYHNEGIINIFLVKKRF